MLVSEKGTRVMSEAQKNVESDLKEYKIDFYEKEKVGKLNLEVSMAKMDLERASRWTHSSRIINQLSSRN